MDARQWGIAGIAIEGDQLAGQQYVPRAKSLLRHLTERVELGGIQTASDFVRLDDNAYVYGSVAMGIRRAVIVVDTPEQAPAKKPQRLVVPDVPDFYSGAVLNGYLPAPPVTTPPTPLTLQTFWPTTACARLFGLVQNPQNVTKLTVKPFASFGELAAPENSTRVYSQYTKLKPTMYSGRMRQVVQLLMGYGRQAKESIYDKAEPKVGATPRERARKALSQYQSEVAANGLQIRYDWRFQRTHGITTAADGRLWLVEIGLTRGILAMPLDYHPVSQLPAFRDKLVQMGDEAGLFALDELGGFPTGETLPVSAIDSWVRAGRVLRLATYEQMAPFYNKGAFSSALGWAFSLTGNEAHNTCVTHDDDGFQTAYHYACRLLIGAMRTTTKPANGPALKARFSAQASDERYPAVMWKIDHLTDEQVGSWIRQQEPAAFLFDQLDAFQNTILASGSGGLYEQERGRLYKKGKEAQYDLKFPSPELGYLVSWDMQSEQAFHGRCDTTVHVFFAGDQLKYVKFFNDQSTIPWSNNQDDSDGCELIGVFTRTTEAGIMALPTMVYSNDFDDRDEFPTARTVTITTGVSLGYSSITAVDDIVYPPAAHISRTKRFKVDIHTETTQGEGRSSAMVVPFYDRCAYYYAVAKSHSVHTVSTGSAYRYQADPWSAFTWRNFPGYTGNYAGDINNGHWVRLDQHPDGCGPVTARTVRAPGAVYDGGGLCDDFADSGPWIGTCDNADARLYQIPEPPLPESTYVDNSRDVAITAYLVNDSSFSPSMSQNVVKDPGSAAYPWFTMSPDPESLATQYIDVCHNAFGPSNVMRYFDAPNGNVLVRGGPVPPGLAGTNTTFIGAV